VCELARARAKQVLHRELFAAARVHRRVPPPPSKVEPAASSFVEYKAATSHRPPPPCSSAWWSIHPSPRGFMNSGPTYVRMQLGTEPFPFATCHSGRCGCHGVWHTSSTAAASRDWQSAQHRPAYRCPNGPPGTDPARTCFGPVRIGPGQARPVDASGRVGLAHVPRDMPKPGTHREKSCRAGSLARWASTDRAGHWPEPTVERYINTYI
jgi:hypothetical protein